MLAVCVAHTCNTTHHSEAGGRRNTASKPSLGLIMRLCWKQTQIVEFLKVPQIGKHALLTLRTD